MQYTPRYSGSCDFATRSSAASTTGIRASGVSPTAGPIWPSLLTQQSAVATPRSASIEARQVRVRPKNSCRRGRSWPIAGGSSRFHSSTARSALSACTPGSLTSVSSARRSR